MVDLDKIISVHSLVAWIILTMLFYIQDKISDINKKNKVGINDHIIAHDWQRQYLVYFGIIV